MTYPPQHPSPGAKPYPGYSQTHGTPQPRPGAEPYPGYSQTHGTPQPRPGAEPYPGFSQTHGTQQQAHAAQQSSDTPLRWVLSAATENQPPPALRLTTEQRAAYDNARKVLRAKNLRTAILIVVGAVGVITAIIQAILR